LNPPEGRDATAGGRGHSSKLRVLIVFAEILMVSALVLSWFFSEEVRSSKNLLVLFFYSIPAGFLVGLLPHEPILLLFGQSHPALTVAGVFLFGWLLAERLNYSILGLFGDLGVFETLRRKRLVGSLLDLFGKAPFLALVTAVFVPIPFFPFRVLVVMEGYPVWRYLLAIAVARGPRYLILAAVGHRFHIPGWVLVGLFLVLAGLVYLPLIRRGVGGREGVGGNPTI